MISSNSVILLHSRLLKWAKATLAELVRPYSGGEGFNTKVVEGIPHIEVIREVLRHDYDLVIKPINSGDFLDRLLGRVDMRLLRHCPCAVWMSKGEVYGNFDSVLAAVDVGEEDERDDEAVINRQILELAFSLCETNDAVLHVGHVWHSTAFHRYSEAVLGHWDTDSTRLQEREKDHYRNWLTRLVAKSKSWVGGETFDAVNKHTHLREGDTGAEIANLINEFEANVIVLGTIARSGIAGMVMGNRAEEILEQVTCSVLAVKPPGFVSRVELDD